MGPKPGGVPLFSGFWEKQATSPPASLPLWFWHFRVLLPQPAYPSLFGNVRLQASGGGGVSTLWGAPEAPGGWSPIKFFQKNVKFGGGPPLGPEKMEFLDVFWEVLFCRKEVFGPPGTCGSLTPDKFQLLMVTLKETPPRILEIWTKVVSGEAPPRDP